MNSQRGRVSFPRPDGGTDVVTLPAARVEPSARFEVRKGVVCIITSGDLPEFPEWFEREVDSILERLRREAVFAPPRAV
jgi:hypothetical protein